MQGLPRLNASVMSGDESQDQRPFTDPIIATVMQASAQMASEAAVKQGKQDDMDRTAKQKPIEIHTRIDPVTGASTKTYKNIPDGSDTDVAIAEKAMQPYLDASDSVTSAALSNARAMAAQSVAAYMQSLRKPSTMGGERLFGPGVSRFRAGYRASRELDQNPILSALDGLRVKLGMISPESAQGQVDRSRAAKIIGAEHAFAAPIQEEQTRIEAAGGTAASREQRRISDLNGRATKLLQTTDFTSVEPTKWYEAVVNQDPAIAELPGLKNRVNVAGQIQTKKDNETRYTESRKDRGALGTFSSYDDVKSAFGAAPDDEKEAQRKADWTAARDAFVKADEKSKLDLKIKAGTLMAQLDSNKIQAALASAAARNASGEAAIASLPKPTQDLIRGIASGQIDITKVTSNRRGDRENIAQLVTAFDPTYSTGTAPARAATYRDYYAGQTKSKAIDPLNTAIHHLDAAKDSAKALGNAPVQVWNRIRQYGLQSLAGDPRYSKFIADTTLLSGEIAKLSKGGVPDKEELATVNKLLSTVNSPQQLDAALNEYVKLMAGRAQPLVEGYTARTGSLPPEGLILTKSSESILRKRGFADVADEITGRKASAAPAAAGQVISLDDALKTIRKKKP